MGGNSAGKLATSLPTTIERGAEEMQVCVPDDWGDWRVTKFADSENECGTDRGWRIRKEGDKALQGDPERQPCSTLKHRVHIVLTRRREVLSTTIADQFRKMSDSATSERGKWRALAIVLDEIMAVQEAIMFGKANETGHAGS